MLQMNDIHSKSYEITFIMFICVTALTYMRSIRNDVSQKTSLTLQLSSFVTMIASMHYYLMLQSKNNINIYRYFDWFITTPVLLIELCYLLDITDYIFIFELIVYNTIMLGIGFIGEIGNISLIQSTIFGFIPLGIMFKKLRTRLLSQKYTKKQINLLNIFFGLWSLYGINNLLNNRILSNTIFNGLDLLTKGAFGLYIFANSFN